MSGSRPVQSVVRSLALLNAIASEVDAGVVELAAATQLSPGTVHRLLATLVAEGYVAHDPVTRRYRLGLQLFTVAAAGERDLARLTRAAGPALLALRDAYDETTNLVVLDRASAIYVDQVESRRPVRLFSRVGNRVPAHASGAGKALLAGAPPETVEALLATAPLEALTPRTLTTVAQLEGELATIRRRGYAFDEEEHDDGVTCVAAAIRGPGGRTVGALSVSGPTERMRQAPLHALGADVAAAAADVASAL